MENKKLTYYQKNRAKILKRQKEWYHVNKDKINNDEKKKEYKRNYYSDKDRREKHNKYCRENNKKRYHEDEIYRQHKLNYYKEHKSEKQNKLIIVT